VPYENEHSCRRRSPNGYARFRRENNWQTHEGKPLHAIWGITSEGKTELQAIRYPKSAWTAEAARSHCRTHGGMSFEPAAK
jgi:hypothetical protein